MTLPHVDFWLPADPHLGDRLILLLPRDAIVPPGWTWEEEAGCWWKIATTLADIPGRPLPASEEGTP